MKEEAVAVTVTVSISDIITYCTVLYSTLLVQLLVATWSMRLQYHLLIRYRLVGGEWT